MGKGTSIRTCKHCKVAGKTVVQDSREILAIEGKRRRIVCTACGYRWNTVEVDQEIFNALRAMVEGSSVGNDLLDRIRDHERKLSRALDTFNGALRKGGGTYYGRHKQGNGEA